MIELKSEQLLTKFVQICTQFFKNYTQTVPHFFQNAEVFLSPGLKFDEKYISESLKTLFMSYRDNGYWFLFEDKFLGKISIYNSFDLYIKNEWVPAKILSIYELELDNHFGILNQRKICVLNLTYLKKYKNQLIYTSENIYHTLFFDILTGLKLWEYTSHSYDSNPETYYKDLKNYFFHYNDEALKLRCQFISLKSSIKEFPLERIIKNLINPIHYANEHQQNEVLKSLNAVFNPENIYIFYDKENQTIKFEKNLNNNEITENQVVDIDSVSAQIQSLEQKIEILFENDVLLPVLCSRLKELEVIYKNDCYLSTVVIIGSLLEALLKKKLYEIEDNYLNLKDLPKDTKDNKSYKTIKVLNFKEMIDIYDKNSIISNRSIISLIDSYRDFRNQIHIYHDDSKNSMNSDICEIGFRVLKMLINELYEKKQSEKA